MEDCEERAEFVRDRHVTLLSDYSASGIWDKQSACTPLEWLPVTQALLRMVQKWQEQYDASDPYDRESKFDREAHAAVGLQLAKRIKRQLPLWTVTYHDYRIGSKYQISFWRALYLSRRSRSEAHMPSALRCYFLMDVRVNQRPSSR